MRLVSSPGSTTKRVEAPRAKVVLVNPRFEPSYWGLQHSLPFIRKRSVFPNSALPLIAACTPADYEVTLVDDLFSN